MRVRLGWSGEIDSKWHKVDVELEEDDLQRMFYAADIGAKASTVSTKVAFHLLKNEAEVLLLTKLVAQGYPADKASARQKVLEDQIALILGRVGSAA